MEKHFIKRILFFSCFLWLLVFSQKSIYACWWDDDTKSFVCANIDIGVKEILTPQNNDCGDSNTVIGIVVRDYGWHPQQKYEVKVLVIRNATIDTLSETMSFQGQRPAYSVDTIYFKKKLQTYYGGGVDLIAYTVVAGDTVNKNDTAKSSIYFIPSLTPPTSISDVDLCGANKIQLINKSPDGDTTLWYDDLNNGPVFRGDTFPVDVHQTGTYYYSYARPTEPLIAITEIDPAHNYIEIQNLRNQSYDASGWAVAISNSFDSINEVNPIIWRLSNFDPWEIQYKQGFKKSLGNYWGNLIMWGPKRGGWAMILDTATGGIIDLVVWEWTASDLKNFKPVVCGKKIKLNDEWKGDGHATCGYGKNIYRVSVDHNTKSDFTCGRLSEYKPNMNMSIDRDVCESILKHVKVTVHSFPDVSFKEGTTFQGENYSFMKNTDLVCTRDTLEYEITPPVGYSNSQYGVDWEITGLKINTANGTAPADTAFIKPDTSKNAMIRFVAADSELDSVFTIVATVSFLKTGCDTTIARNILIKATPEVDFSVDNTCFGEQVKFTNKSTVSGSILNSLWRFGNGDSSTKTTPLYQYPSKGIYDVNLTAISAWGCTSSITRPIAIHENPVAKFHADEKACKNSPFVLTDSSSSGEAPIKAYHYYSGDGQTSSQSSPAFIYDSTGVFNASLMVTDTNGCSDSISRQVEVLNSPKVHFGFTNPCVDEKTAFIDSSVYATPLSYSWQFGNHSNSKLRNPLHQFKDTGAFAVKLIATSIEGCHDSSVRVVRINPAPQASFSTQDVCLGSETVFNNTTLSNGITGIHYYWDFDDGKFSMDKHPTHTFYSMGNKKVQLTATSSVGCDDTVLNIVEVSDTPRSSFSYTISNGKVSFSPNYKLYKSYHWDFGNGQASADISPSITYTKDSTYKVTLEVTNGNNCKSSRSKWVDISLSSIEQHQSILNNLTIYPNPFNQKTTISYVLKEPSMVKIEILSINGNTLKVLLNSNQSKGIYEIQYDSGNRPSGIYLVRMILNDQMVIRPVMEVD